MHTSPAYCLSQLFYILPWQCERISSPGSVSGRRSYKQRGGECWKWAGKGVAAVGSTRNMGPLTVGPHPGMLMPVLVLSEIYILFPKYGPHLWILKSGPSNGIPWEPCRAQCESGGGNSPSGYCEPALVTIYFWYYVWKQELLPSKVLGTRVFLCSRVLHAKRECRMVTHCY